MGCLGILCGFQNKKSLQIYVEKKWKYEIMRQQKKGIKCVKAHALYVQRMLAKIDYHMYAMTKNDLRLVLFFNEVNIDNNLDSADG